MRIAFRTDSSREIGIGHLMRCLSLAEELYRRGHEIIFICRKLKGDFSSFVRERGFKLVILSLPSTGTTTAGLKTSIHEARKSVTQVADAEQTIAELGRLNDEILDWLIVDHYSLDYRWEQEFRSSVRQLMVIDDLADRTHDCDFLVDPGIDPNLLRKYEELTPKHCFRLIGPRYAMLRPEFDEVRSANRQNRIAGVPKRIAVLFGGKDDSRSTLEALKALRKSMPLGTTVDVIVSVTNLDRTAITQFCRENMDFILHVATGRVASLFMRADLSIGSGGGATYERLFLRLPSILKPVAANQRNPLYHLSNLGLVNLYENDRQLLEKLRKVFEYGVTQPMDVVCNGVPTICNALLNKLVFLRPPIPLDLRRTLRWLQDSDLRYRFMMAKKPERTTHFSYWRKLLHSDTQCVFSIYQANVHFGNAGIKHIDRAGNQAELWLYIGETNRRGRGLGKLILRQLENYIKAELDCKTAIVHVRPTNLQAYQLFRKSGYVPCPKNDSKDAGFSPFMKVMRMEKTL